MSDPSNLDFTYDLNFRDPKTIVIQLKFKNPIYVSASQPEDVLVVTFWGPIFDQQDGLEIPRDKRVIRRAIPPQIADSPFSSILD